MPDANRPGSRIAQYCAWSAGVDLNRWVWADDETLFEYTHIVANGVLHEFTYTYELDEEAST